MINLNQEERQIVSLMLSYNLKTKEPQSLKSKAN